MSAVPSGIDRLNSAVVQVPEPPTGATVLVVDDLLLDRRMVKRVLEQHGGWLVSFASNGVEALAALGKEVPRVVLTDLQMPQMDGLALVEQIRDKHPQVPVILMTRSGSEEIAVRALRSGASSYVPKRNLASELVPTLQQVLAASKVDRQREKMLSCLNQRDSRFTLENDPTLLPPLVALLQEDLAAMGLCDATGVTRVGVALAEALLNALYHGNLEVHTALRREGDEAFQRQVAQRRQLAPFRHRRIQLFAHVTPAEAVYVIVDQGPGFDPASLPDPTDPTHLERGGGRGVVLMHTFMDRVTYSRTGNQVTMVKRREKRGEQP
jgi:CheY-like chemotaxis protein